MDRAIKLGGFPEASGKFENTLICFSATTEGPPERIDQPPWPDTREQNEGGTRVPFFAHWPKLIQETQNARSDDDLP